MVESGKALRRTAKEAVASLVHASPQEVLLTENTTEGLNIVLNGLPWEAGDEIVTCHLEHGSILLPAYRLSRRKGIVVRVLPVAPDEEHDVVLARVEAALTERTRMVFLSHVEYSSGLRMPVKEIGRLAKARGALLLLDGAQAAGHISVDVRDIDCDFYALPGQKWLLGPDETGALYIRESLVPMVEPTRIGLGAARENEFDQTGEYVPETTIDKLAASTSSAPLRAGFVAAIGFVQAVGLGEIEDRNLSLASLLKAGLTGLPGVRVISPMDGPGCSGLVSFTIGGVEPKAAAEALWRHSRILVRAVVYPPCVRASTHFFNTDEEVERLLGAVRGLA
jgi:L-cysteine/cystine lyase